MALHALLLSSIIATAVPDVGPFTDDQIVALGHSAWIARVANGPQDANRIAEAERAYAMAVNRRNHKLISGSSQKAFYDGLIPYLSTVTKGMCRFSDYIFAGSDTGSLVSMQAEALCALTIHNLLTKRPAMVLISETDVWRALREAQAFHRKDAPRIDAFGRTLGGYPAWKYQRDFEGLSGMMRTTFGMMKGRSASDKGNINLLFQRLLKLTVGEHPIPAEPSRQN